MNNLNSVETIPNHQENAVLILCYYDDEKFWDIGWRSNNGSV